MSVSLTRRFFGQQECVEGGVCVWRVGSNFFLVRSLEEEEEEDKERLSAERVPSPANQLLQGLERNGGISGPVHRQSRPGMTALNTLGVG